MLALSSAEISSETRFFSYLLRALKLRRDLWAQFGRGVTSQTLGRWCPRRGDILHFWRAASPSSLASFVSNLGCKSSAQETILDRLLTRILPCKGHLLHDLKAAHPVLAVIIHLQAAIECSPSVTSLKEDGTSWKKLFKVYQHHIQISDTTGQIFRRGFGKQRGSGCWAPVLSPSLELFTSPFPLFPNYHFHFQSNPYPSRETKLFESLKI